MSTEPQKDEGLDDSSAPLIEHLAELRNRLIWSVLAFVVAMVLCYTVWKPIYNFLTQPICAALDSRGQNCQLQIIKLQEGFGKTSGIFIMVKGDEKLLMSDCAITIAPDANDLAENAILSAKTAKSFGIDPVIAMLSFSTKGSAESDETKRVEEATRIAKDKDPSLVIDGELQFDAAYVESVGKSKAKDSPVAGHANTFIYPSLEAGNIGYKIAQRLGGYEAIGPILQGMNKPVNDLSRGCNEEDVYKLALITAAQSL